MFSFPTWFVSQSPLKLIYLDESKNLRVKIFTIYEQELEVEVRIEEKCL